METNSILNKIPAAHSKTNQTAIVGIGVTLPFADTVDMFWKQLISGQSLIRGIPGNRKNKLASIEQYLDNSSGHLPYEHGAYLNDIDYFDHEFFGITPKEARLMDPSQRIFLQTTWHALEDAGYSGGQLSGSNIGVYIGYSGENDYKRILDKTNDKGAAQAVTGNISACIASRIAYFFDFHGPNMIINTLCSSSLVSVHLACKAIANGECDAAVAGGIQLHTIPIRTSRLGIESNSNKVASFSQEADGTCPGEGAISFFLKPLERAINHHDNIYAVICGSAVNCDGTSVGIAAPNPRAQSAVIQKAWKDSGIPPESISYIETHGTGTQLGDSIEIEGISKAFQTVTQKKQFCAIGSVKTNIGHLDASAGAAGLLKLALALKNQKIPPSLNFQLPNSNISFVDSPIYLNNTLTDWDIKDGIRRGGVSSFGLGGTNCHIVLEEYNKKLTKHSETKREYVLVLSACNKNSLSKLIVSYMHLFYTSADEHLKDICYTSACGRAHHHYRAAIIVSTKKHAYQKLKSLLRNKLKSQPKCGIYCTVYPASELVPGRTIDGLCVNYINGGNINWIDHFGHMQYEKANLPQYPFVRKSFWPVSSKQEKETSFAGSHQMYYTEVWVRNELPLIKTNMNKSSKTIIIIAPNIPFVQSLCDTFATTECNLIRMFFSENHELSKTGKNNGFFELNKLFSSLNLQEPVELFFCTPFHQYFRNAQEANQLIILFSQLIEEVRRKTTKNLSITLITRHIFQVTKKEKHYNPAMALLYGYLKVAMVENPNIVFRMICCDGKVGDIHHIVQETQSIVAYRDGHRYLPVIRSAVLKKNKKTKIKGNGVHVIIGGGTLGMAVADYLYSKAETIVIITKTKMPDPREWLDLLDLEIDSALRNRITMGLKAKSLGVHVAFYQTDITDEVNSELVFSQIRKNYGGIQGVYYCAGIGVGHQGWRIGQEPDRIIQEVLSPKMDGILVADKLTRKDNLVYFVILSSLITVTGGVNAGCYAAANSFASTFTYYRNQLGLCTKNILLAPYKKSVKAKSNNEFIFSPLGKKKFQKAIHHCIHSNYEELMVGKINFSHPLLLNSDLLPFHLEENLNDQREKIHEVSETNLVARQIKFDNMKNTDRNNLTQLVADIFLQCTGLQQIKYEESIFEMGGDSIVCTEIIQMINRELGMHFQVKDLMRHSSVLEFCGFVLENFDHGPKYKPIPKAPKQKSYPLSHVQRQYYVMEMLYPSLLNNLPEAKIIEGDLDIEKLQDIVNKVIRNHPILRISVQLENGKPVQIVHPNLYLKIEGKPLCGNSIEEAIASFIRPFDLYREALIRMQVSLIGKHKYLLLMDMHHMISDAISKKALYQEISDLYNNRQTNKERCDYLDYIQWLELYDTTEHRKYWLDQFQEYRSLAFISSDNQKSPENGQNGESIDFWVSHDVTLCLRKIAENCKISLFAVLFGAYALLVMEETMQEEAIVGTVASGRVHPDLMETLGAFVNFLPIRCNSENGQTVESYLKKTAVTINNAIDHQLYPLENIIKDLNTSGITQDRALYQTVFIMQNARTVNFELPGTLIRDCDIPIKFSRLALTVEAEEADNKIHVKFEYNTNLYTENRIQRLIQHYIGILNQWVTGSVKQSIT